MVVDATVDGVVCSPNACLLSFEPGFSGLIVAIPGEVRGAFPDPERTYSGRRVRVSGTIGERAGRPRLEVRQPAAIELVAPGAGTASRVVAASSTAAPAVAVESAPGVSVAVSGGLIPGTSSPPPAGVIEAAPMPREQAAASVERAAEAHAGLAGGRVRVEGAPPRGVAPSAADVARRLGLEAGGEGSDDGGVAVDGGGELALLRGDIAEIGGRVEALEAAIGEILDRLAVLEEVAGPALAERAAREASVGVAPPRAAPSLQRIRRGSSARQVLRLMGEPDLVEANPRGQYTWSWGGGRSVVVDANGTVLSAVGF